MVDRQAAKQCNDQINTGSQQWMEQETPAKKVHDAQPLFADPLKQPTNYVTKRHNYVINN